MNLRNCRKKSSEICLKFFIIVSHLPLLKYAKINSETATTLEALMSFINKLHIFQGFQYTVLYIHMERKTKHFVCVCIAHQNTKLMASGVKVKDLTSDISLEIEGYVNSQSLTTMIYSPSTEECFSVAVLHNHYRNC
jgi:hypothetical protein